MVNAGCLIVSPADGVTGVGRVHAVKGMCPFISHSSRLKPGHALHVSAFSGFKIKGKQDTNTRVCAQAEREPRSGAEAAVLGYSNAVLLLHHNEVSGSYLSKIKVSLSTGGKSVDTLCFSYTFFC